MYYTYSFCTVVKALMCLLMALDVSNCHHMDKRNALLIVGNTFYVSFAVLACFVCLCLDVRIPDSMSGNTSEVAASKLQASGGSI